MLWGQLIHFKLPRALKALSPPKKAVPLFSFVEQKTTLYTNHTSVKIDRDLAGNSQA
jgi:hypothetical protein